MSSNSQKLYADLRKFYQAVKSTLKEPDGSRYIRKEIGIYLTKVDNADKLEILLSYADDICDDNHNIVGEDLILHDVAHINIEDMIDRYDWRIIDLINKYFKDTRWI